MRDLAHRPRKGGQGDAGPTVRKDRSSMPTVDPNQLRARREAAGLTREQAATALAKSFKAIEAFERGANVPPGNVLVAMARLYGVAVEDLCRDGEPAGAR